MGLCKPQDSYADLKANESAFSGCRYNMNISVHTTKVMGMCGRNTQIAKTEVDGRVIKQV